MGISSIFKLAKASGPPASGGNGSDSAKTRLVRKSQPAAPVPEAAAASTGRAARCWRRAPPPATSPASSDNDDGLQTPDDSSRGSGPCARGTIQAPARQLVQPAKARSDDSDLFWPGSLRTPPLDTQASPLKELDPFEDSPPRRPMTDFEDPTYIPPLTLTATLFDDYGLAAGALASSKPLAAEARTEKAKAPRASAAARPRAPLSNAAKPVAPAISAPTETLDLLGEFTATYNYLFGAPPSDTVTATFAGTGGAPGAAAVGGLLSPANPQPAKPCSPAKADDSCSLASSTSASSDGGDDVSSAGSASADKRDLEERRKEEERKAAEQRSRRREVLKQQVAFERMKERHRRQCPGQSTSPYGSMARWQKEAAGPVHGQGAPPSGPRGLLHASCATIGRSGVQGAPQPPPALSQSYAALHAGRYTAVFSPGAASAAPLAAMAGYADAPVAHPWPMQALPLLADPATGLVYGSPTSPVPVPLLPAAAAAAAATPYHLTASPPTSPERPPAQPAISAHPVRLASTPRGAKNAYLSDSSGDDVDDEDSSSSLCDSDDMSDAGLLHTVQTVPHAVTSSQLGSTRAPSDASSSEESGRSQSSSKRRVRFHETVAVVFNTRPPVTEDEDEDEDGGGEGLLSDPGADSGNGSSNASVGQSRSCGLGETCAAARPTPASPLAVANGGCATDDAFDDAGAPGHLRYRIPPSVVPGTASDPPPQRDGAAASRAHPTHRVETQPLRDHEAEREQWQKGVGEPAANGRRAPAWDQPPKSQEAQGRGPAAGEAGGNHSAAASDPVTEARRALLGHYSVPHPMHPVGNSIPRSGAMSPTLPRGSGVKIIGPQSFARARSCAASGAAQQPKCTLPSPKHRPHSGKPQSPAHQPARSDGHDLTRSAATPMARPAAGPKPDHDQQKARGVGWEPDAVRRSASCGASSDPDDVPLSAIARSKSEPLPGPAPEAGSAKHQYRLFGWPPKEQRGPVLVRNSTRAPSKDNSLARPAAAEARSASMDAARHVAVVGASPSGKRRLHRWDNII